MCIDPLKENAVIRRVYVLRSARFPSDFYREGGEEDHFLALVSIIIRETAATITPRHCVFGHFTLPCILMKRICFFFFAENVFTNNQFNVDG